MREIPTVDNDALRSRAMAVRPKVGGFSVLAEILRQSGVRKNVWYLPATLSLYLTDYGPVVSQGTPLVAGLTDVPQFNREAVICALRADQACDSTFPEFLQAMWNAGVLHYEVDFDTRNVTYYGAGGDSYLEAYPQVEV